MKAKIDMGAAQLVLAGDGQGRILVAQTDTYRIRVMSPDGKTTGWLSRSGARRKLSRAEQARIKQMADSSVQKALKSVPGTSAGGRATPRPEFEFVAPEYAPAFLTIIAGDRFVLAAQAGVNALPDRPETFDIIGYDGRFLGTFKPSRRFIPYAALGDRLYGLERDEFDVENVAVYRITPPK
jgi:hypothetical protein